MPGAVADSPVIAGLIAEYLGDFDEKGDARPALLFDIDLQKAIAGQNVQDLGVRSLLFFKLGSIFLERCVGNIS